LSWVQCQLFLPDNETEEEKAKKKENDNKLWDD
jgi:hypothetical protein